MLPLSHRWQPSWLSHLSVADPLTPFSFCLFVSNWPHFLILSSILFILSVQIKIMISKQHGIMALFSMLFSEALYGTTCYFCKRFLYCIWAMVSCEGITALILTKILKVLRSYCGSSCLGTHWSFYWSCVLNITCAWSGNMALQT